MMLKLPAYLSPANPGLMNKLMGGLGASQPPTISRRNNRFTLVQANGETHGALLPSLTLDVVIVGGNEHSSKVYYENAYNPEEASAPDCWSDNGVGPSSQAAKPQNDLCATCPQNKWGSRVSKVSGKPVQACQTYKKIACLVMGDRSGTVYLLAIPPASLGAWRGYTAHLAGQNVSAEQIVTRLMFADKELGVLKFEPVGFIAEDFVEPIKKIIESGEADTVTGANDQPSGTALQAPRETRQISAQPEYPVPESIPRRARRTAAQMQEAQSVPNAAPEKDNEVEAEKDEEVEAEITRYRAELAAKKATPAPGKTPVPREDISNMLNAALKLTTR
jgi:hypothetical protein